MSGNVVDELVVKLTLDASEFKKADKAVDQQVEKTAKKRGKEDGARAKRDDAQSKRNKQNLSETKSLTSAMKALSIAGGAVGAAAGVAVSAVAAIAGSVIALTGMETNLRRTAVSTNMSNREMQAWGSTAKRMGADAESGRQAIADLAKEQQQFNLTGIAPTLAAFSNLGINATPDTPIQDLLADAQKMYRAANPGQQKQMEAQLSAQGVSADLILMMKSEQDARATFAKSFAESAEEDRAAMDAVTDAMASVENAATSVANSFAIVLGPAIQSFAEFLATGASGMSAFADRIKAAGGGVDGFINVMTADFPTATKVVVGVMKMLGEDLEVVWIAIKQISKGLMGVVDFIQSIPGVKNAMSGLADKFFELRAKVMQTARNIDKPAPGAASVAPPALSAVQAQGKATPQAVMSYLIGKHGLNVAQAAAVAANIQAESGGDPSAFNPAGGGRGAMGAFQHRGARIAAFEKQTGKSLRQASWQEQIDFVMSDKYESSLLKRALGGGGDAEQLGKAFSDMFEGQGNAAQTLKRGKAASDLAASYSGPGAGNPGTSISIQSVTVQASNVDDMIGGIQRIAGPQNYNSAVRY